MYMCNICVHKWRYVLGEASLMLVNVASEAFHYRSVETFPLAAGLLMIASSSLMLDAQTDSDRNENFWYVLQFIVGQ